VLGGTTGHIFHYELELWLRGSTVARRLNFKASGDSYALCTTAAVSTSYNSIGSFMASAEME